MIENVGRKVAAIHHEDGTFLFWKIWCPACRTEHCLSSAWTFNGNFDKPTFSPSLRVQGCLNAELEQYGTCHSFIKDGNIEFLSDCTHVLVAQTVELPGVWAFGAEEKK